jgi:hypothetical protein
MKEFIIVQSFGLSKIKYLQNYRISLRFLPLVTFYILKRNLDSMDISVLFIILSADAYPESTLYTFTILLTFFHD